MTLDKAFPCRVIIDHLPKTAGTAINTWLIEALGAGCVIPALNGNHRDLIRQYGGLYSVICAHVHFHAGEGLDPRYQYITFFREPIDRAVSWTFYLANDAGVTRDTIPLKDGVSQFLASDGSESSPEFLESITNPYTEHFCRIKGNGLESDDEKIANALAVIKQYDVVGVYQDMPRFLADVAALIGLPPPQEIARINVTTQRPQVDQISPALRERIVALNQLDLRLFAEVVAWKSSAVLSESTQVLPLSTSKWKRYEPVRERVVTTPDVTIYSAALREGYDIRHGQLMTFDVDFFLSREVHDLEMGIHLFDSDRQWAFGINSTLLGQSHQSLPSGSYRVSHHLVADLPAGKYTAGFAFAELLPEGRQQELAWCDVMCEFQVYHQVSKTFAGYSYLPAAISLSPTRLAAAEMVVTQPAGSLLVEMPISSMVAGMQANIGITIVNRSEQVWVGDSFRPVNLSYHWLKDSGEIMVFDGMRTPLPADGVGPGQALGAEMLVEAPREAGIYILVLTLVQELVGWFEDKGFEAARLEVEVEKVAEIQPETSAQRQPATSGARERRREKKSSGKKPKESFQ
jgi:Wzt-like putative exopolysaccharide export protein